MLDQLEQEHRIGAEKIRDLDQALARYQNGGPAELDAFADAVEAYAAMHWTHMRTEETEVLPRAEKTFTADDWKIVDAAFGSHGDPLLGVDRGTQYEALFRRIVNLAPPPIGVGPERY